MGKTVTAKVYVHDVNVLIWTSQPIKLNQVGNAATVGTQSGLVEVLTGGIASDVYRFGSTFLRIDVQIEGSNEIYSNLAELEVVADQVSSIAWEFGAITGTEDPKPPTGVWAPFGTILKRFVIKHPFTIAGRVRNQATSSTSLNVQVLLEETDPDGKVTFLEDRMLQTAPGLSQDIVFNSLTKNWTWLISGVWVRNFSEPLMKSWRYRVHLKLTDPWNNVYDVVSATQLQVDIVVTDAKMAYANSALGALGGSIVLAILSFGAIAGALGGAAAGFGAKALDPPVASSRFGEPVVVPKVIARSERELGVLTELVTRLEELVVLIESSNEARDRILGASQAGDRKALTMQRKGYQRILNRTLAVLDWMESHSDEILAFVESRADMSFESSRSVVRQAQREGLPASARASMRKAGGTPHLAKQLSAALHNDTVAELAMDLSLCTRIVLESMVHVGLSVRAEAEAILK